MGQVMLLLGCLCLLLSVSLGHVCQGTLSSLHASIWSRTLKKKTLLVLKAIYHWTYIFPGNLSKWRHGTSSTPRVMSSEATLVRSRREQGTRQQDPAPFLAQRSFASAWGVAQQVKAPNLSYDAGVVGATYRLCVCNFGVGSVRLDVSKCPSAVLRLE